MLIRLGFFAAALVMLVAPVEAQQPASYAMQLNGRTLSGPGADMLRADIRNSEVILFGEEHGFAASPQIVHALLKDARAAGFSYYAAEISPWMAKTFGETWKAGGVEALQKKVHDNPLAIPFVSLKEDAELAAEFLGADAKGVPYLWGVDQEFVGSPTLLLQRLVEMAPNEKVRTRVALMLSAERMAQQGGELEQLFLMNAQPAWFDSLDKDFVGVPEAQDIVEAMRLSAEIYQYYKTGDNYENNARRARLMSDNFLAAYRGAAAQPPKVIMRLGAFHAGVGTTPTNVVDLGTLASAAARLHGKRALRIAFLPAGGQRAAFLPTPGNPYVISNYADSDVSGFLTGIGVDVALLPKGQFTLIPLQPVREKIDAAGIEKLAPFGKFALLGFDYLITTPDGLPATPLY